MITLLSILLIAGRAGSCAPAAKPEIAVVIDDFGLTYKKNVPDRDWMKIKWPITFAVMPESPRTAKAAKETLANGHQLLIHFPFDPFLRLKLPPGRVSKQDMARVRGLLKKSFAQIPGASGLNNHRSLRATMNRPLMAAFMRLIKLSGIFFIDSRVSAKSVAYREAKKAGVRTAQNFIFLEEPHHYNDEAFAKRMIERAARRARKTGRVLLIGHHYFQGTYNALTAEEPKLKAEGFQFVFASKLAR
ncbi:MAG: divergent polysaccharide deacetylase family protein [Elusimicrobiota bacterium]